MEIKPAFVEQIISVASLSPHPSLWFTLMLPLIHFSVTLPFHCPSRCSLAHITNAHLLQLFIFCKTLMQSRAWYE